MAHRKRIVVRASARRPPRGPVVTLTTCHMSLAAALFLLSVLLVSPAGGMSDPGTPAGDPDPGPASAALTVSVSETSDAVRLRIQASGDIEPGSVEVRFAGRKVVVLARDAEGRSIRSQPVRLPSRVLEEGASAHYDAEDALVMTLRKQGTAQAAPTRGDPEAAR